MISRRAVLLGKVAKPVSVRASTDCTDPVYSVTKHAGMVPSSEYFKKQVFSRDIEGYKSVCRGQFAYATIHLDEGSIGLLDTADRAVVSPMYTVFETDSAQVYGPYLLRLLKSEWALSRYQTMGNGSVHRRRAIPFETLEKLEIALPDVEEQKRIATILDKADTLRRQRHQAIRLADDFLRAVFFEMFGDPIGKDVNRVSLAKVMDIDAPMVDPRLDEYADMLHVGPDRIEKDTGRLLKCKTAREEGLISKKFLFDDSYVLYSKIRPYLRKCALATFTGLCSADMYPVRPKVGVATREFLWALLLSNEFDRYVASLPDRANIPKLNRDELNAFEFNLPSIQKQEKFSAIIQKRIAYTNLLDCSYANALRLANSLQAHFL